MAEVEVHEAQANLSDLLRRVQTGEEFVIMRGGTPVARLVPVAPAKRRLGRDEGVFTVPDDFDEPLSEEMLRTFES